MLPLGSPSFSISLLKTKALTLELGSGTTYANVAAHAWSPLNFPHSEDEAKYLQILPGPSCAFGESRGKSRNLGSGSGSVFS